MNFNFININGETLNIGRDFLFSFHQPKEKCFFPYCRVIASKMAKRLYNYNYFRGILYICIVR